MLTTISALFAALAAIGAWLTLLAARAAARLAQTCAPAPAPALAASVLRPLHGASPGLAATDAAVRAQAHAAPFEVLSGVHDAADAARRVVGDAVADARLAGPNRKASQLANLAARARHGVVVAVDADILPPPGWLAAVTGCLAAPGVGLVTSLYRGVPADAGVWSRLAALGIDWQFLPFAAFGEAIGRAQGCYGATMALRVETLAAVGGFEAVAGVLADDHALGAAVRRLGLRVVVAPVLPGHVMAERSLGALFAHELRWARTVRMLDPAGAVGAGLAHPLAWGALAALTAPGWWGPAALGVALAARVGLAVVVDRALGAVPTGAVRTGALAAGAVPAGAGHVAGPASPAGGRGGGRAALGRLALLPLRDALSFAVWVAALAPGAVTWQGRRYRVGRDGAMIELRGSAYR